MGWSATSSPEMIAFFALKGETMRWHLAQWERMPAQHRLWHRFWLGLSCAFFSLALGLPGVALADQLYKCTDENGNPLYTNQKSAGNDCKPMSRDHAITTFSGSRFVSQSRQNKNSSVPRVEQKKRLSLIHISEPTRPY